MAEAAKWYVVHTYSGYENTVKATIERTVESRGLQEQIHAVSIPLETVTEVTESGASKTYDRKGLPRLCAGEDGHDGRRLVYHQERPRRHRVCHIRHQAHPPDGG